MTSKEGHQGITILYGVSQLVGILLCILVLVWSIKFRGGFGWTSTTELFFNWHPFLMTLGLVYLFANSIMFFKAFIDIMEKKERKMIHAGIHALALILALIAQTIVIIHANKSGYTNFTSLHSWLGIATLILFVLQWVVGFVVFLQPGLAIPVRGAVLPHHVFFGFCSFFLAITTCITGVFESSIFNVSGGESFPPEGVLLNCIGLLFVLFGVLVTAYTFTKH